MTEPVRPPDPATPVAPALLGAALLAVAAPTLLAYNLPPSSTLLNQLLAVAGWGVLLMALPGGRLAPAARAAWAPLAALLAVVAAALVTTLWRGAPSGPALSAAGVLLAAAGALLAGAALGGAGRSPGADAGVAAFLWALVGAGVGGAAVGMVQVFVPAWADGDWIARSGLAGRAVGNLRQPNHLSSVLLWGLIALVPLVRAGRVRAGVAALLGAVMTFGVVLTASRTGVVGVLLLAGWGALDTRLPGRLRLALLAVPLVYLAGWAAMAGWAEATAHTFGGEKRLAEADLSASRFGIWANTLALIRQQPWTGVGFGEFNFAWTLTPFPGRPVAFFDHSHNLPLNLLVELGVPLGGVVLALLLWALGQAFARSRGADEPAATARRAAAMMTLMIGLHSLLEYPLWYAYFLLPAAFAWGLALGRAAPGAAAPPAVARWAPAAGVVAVVAATAAWVDYQRVVVIFAPPDGAASLGERVADGQAALLFPHQADYAAVTSWPADGPPPPAQVQRRFDRTTHHLLDVRLMSAWIEALARSGRPGDLDRARHLAERLREFRNPGARAFLEACDAEAAPAWCAPAAAPLRWPDFLDRP